MEKLKNKELWLYIVQVSLSCFASFYAEEKFPKHSYVAYIVSFLLAYMFVELIYVKVLKIKKYGKNDLKSKE